MAKRKRLRDRVNKHTPCQKTTEIPINVPLKMKARSFNSNLYKIYIGKQYNRWSRVKDELGLISHTELAKMLLDMYDKYYKLFHATNLLNDDESLPFLNFGNVSSTNDFNEIPHDVPHTTTEKILPLNGVIKKRNKIGKKKELDYIDSILNSECLDLPDENGIENYDISPQDQIPLNDITGIEVDPQLEVRVDESGMYFEVDTNNQEVGVDDSNSQSSQASADLVDYRNSFQLLPENSVSTDELTDSSTEVDTTVAGGDKRRGKRKAPLPREREETILQSVFTKVAAYAKKKAAESESKLFRCTVCHRPFLTIEDLQSHKIELFHRSSYCCALCGYRSNSAARLKDHVRIHTGEKPYVCVHCDYRSATASGLSYHNRTRKCDLLYGSQTNAPLFSSS